MQEKIRVLIALQNCDRKIEETKRKIDQCPQQMAALDNKVKNAEASIAEMNDRLDAMKKERRQIERDIEDLEVKKKKSQAKLSSVSSNKEYRAALKEMEELDRNRGLLEDKALELMEQMEQLERGLESAARDLDKVRKDTEKERKTLEKEMRELELYLADLARDREQLCNQVDPELLSRYDMLRERRAGLAISPVISGVCQTCHMGIPPQKFNELIRGDHLMSCPNCQRIIYWGDDERLKCEGDTDEG